MSAVQTIISFGHISIFASLLKDLPTSNQSLIQPTPTPVDNPTITESLTELPATTPAPRLRSDYTYTPGIGAHKAYAGAPNWNDARLFCEERGAHLVIINSRAELEVVKQLVKALQSTSFWIGVHDLYKEGQFVTIHGESLEATGFAEWGPGEPNNSGNNEHCVYVTYLDKLNDTPCDGRFTVVCELPL